MSKNISGIKKRPLQRRLSISMAGLKSGTRYATGGLGNLLKSPNRRREANQKLLAREAQLFADELGKLKGAYVKIGQMLGIYGQYILPSPIADALMTLNDRTAPLAWSAIEPQVRQALGKRLEEFTVTENAVAAASLGQVHRALHKPSGNELCFKVQYPDMAEMIENDFRDVIRFLEITRWLRRDSQSRGLIDEVHELLRLEIDYCREARFGARMETLLAGDSRYRVPRVHLEFSTSSLLVMEFVHGHGLQSAEVAALPQNQRNALAESVLELFFKEIFQWRLMQTDPNFGNFLVDTSTAPPTLVLLDFGAVREFEQGLMDALCQTIAGAVERDAQSTIAGLAAIGCFTPDQSLGSKTKFAEFCYLLVEPFRALDEETPDYAVNKKGAYRWGKSNLVRRAAKLAAKSALDTEFTVPPREFALITRKLSGVYSAMAALDAEIDTSGLLQNYIEQWSSHRGA